MKYLVSACLAGESCCYDGTDCADPLIQNLVQRGEALPVCPELLGGLGVPRSPCEIRGEKVLTREGEDVTEAFSCGSKAVLKMACRNSISSSRSEKRLPFLRIRLGLRRQFFWKKNLRSGGNCKSSLPVGTFPFQ